VIINSLLSCCSEKKSRKEVAAHIDLFPGGFDL